MKSTINASGLSKSYNDKIIFDKIDFTVKEGDKIALIGKNGSGKSSLFKLIMGKEKPNDGGIGYKGDIVYIEQEINPNLDNYSIERYFLNYINDYELYKVYSAFEELNLDISDLTIRIGNLSGGQKKKILLSKLLILDSDIILLDEPTNHLDYTTKIWVSDFIEKFKGLVLCISHDRDFINGWANKTLEIENNKINIFDGNYDSYKEMKAVLFERQTLDHINYEKRKEKMKNWLNDLRQRATLHDNPRWGKLLRSKEKFFEREILNKKVEKPKTDKIMRLNMEGGVNNSKLIIELNKIDLKVEEKVIVKNINIRINGKDRIVIKGENGTGKTTLVKLIYESLTGTVKHDRIKVGNNINAAYFDQYNTLGDENLPVYEWYQKNTDTYISDTSIKNHLSVIGIKGNYISRQVKDLSYGEKVKLRFLYMTRRKFDILILDEPTNHLDIQTIESLENMISEYEGCIILISHDDYFINEVLVDSVYEISNGQLKIEN